MTAENREENEGLKFDKGKQEWFAMPLELLEPLADAFKHGEGEYGLFNCLKPFDDPNRRFYDAQFRHTVASQLDPLAIDAKSGCYHLAQSAFNSLMRLYHCKKEMEFLLCNTDEDVKPLCPLHAPNDTKKG